MGVRHMQRYNDMDSTYYFFENEEGLWLEQGKSLLHDEIPLTNDPIKAAKLKDKFEAELFCRSLRYKGFKVTEHEFVTPLQTKGNK